MNLLEDKITCLYKRTVANTWCRLIGGTCSGGTLICHTRRALIRLGFSGEVLRTWFIFHIITETKYRLHLPLCLDCYLLPGFLQFLQISLFTSYNKPPSDTLSLLPDFNYRLTVRSLVAKLVAERKALVTATTVVDYNVPQTFLAPFTGTRGLARSSFWLVWLVWLLGRCEELLACLVVYPSS